MSQPRKPTEAAVTKLSLTRRGFMAGAGAAAVSFAVMEPGLVRGSAAGSKINLDNVEYLIVKEEGPDHDRTFTVDVLLSNVRKGSGSGKNKKDAEQAAAREALDRLLRA